MSNVYPHPAKPKALVLLHPTVTRNVAAISAVEMRTDMKAVWNGRRATLAEQGKPVPMPVIIRNSQGEWL